MKRTSLLSRRSGSLRSCSFGSISIFLSTILLLAIPHLVVGQATGTISGFVMDPSGTPVPGSRVTATQVEHDMRRSVETNAEGFYTFNALPPGVYSVQGEKTGFDRLVRTGAVLEVNQNLRVDLALRLGQVSQEVTVSGQAPLVDTRSGALSAVVDDQRVVDLPLNGRDVIGLAATLPGVANVSAPQQLTDARSGPTMNVNGSFINENLFTFNGGVFVNPSRETALNYPPPDAVQEFSIQTQNFSAEFGRNAGSQVNVVSRSGTNDLHGAAWEFLRNNDLNARNFFAATVSPYKQNQYGAAAGGPIRKNKLFVFGSYQGTQNYGGALSAQLTVPTATQRNGDFTGLGKTLTDPTDPLTGQPMTAPGGAPCISNNIVNSGCVTTMAKTLLPLIPQSASGTATTYGPQPEIDNMYLGRMDWNQSAKNTISGHIYVDHNLLKRLNLVSGSIPNYESGFLGEQTIMATINDTYVFKPNLVNLFTVAFLRDTSLSTTNKNIAPTSLGVNSPLYAEAGAPNISVGSLFTFGGSSGRVVFTNNNFQLRDAANWATGRHNIKFGGEWMHLHFRQIFIGPPTVNFAGTRSGSEIADFLIGAYYSYTGSFGVTTNDNYQQAPSLFVQDEFKVNARFTLTYGLRWEPFLPWNDRYNRLASLAGIAQSPAPQSTRFPDAPPGILFAGDPGVPTAISPNRWHYFAPRLGFAWDVFGDGRTSVRGGYGIFYDSINADSVSEQSAPWTGTFAAYNGNVSDPFGSVGQPIPPTVPTNFGCAKTTAFPGLNCPGYPLPLGGLYTGSNVVSPYIQQWNLTVQRQITKSIMAQVAYVGKDSQHLDGWQSFDAARFVNDPFTGAAPSLQNVNDRVTYLPGILAPNSLVLENNFRGWYHGLQAQLTRRFASGFSFNAAYTFSKSIDYRSNNYLNYSLDDPFNMQYSRGLSDYNRTHVFVASWLWSPQWKTANRIGKFALGGWTLTAIHTIETGVPFTVKEGIDVALDGSSSCCQHAQLVPGATGATINRNWSSQADEIAQYFNTAAFVTPSKVPAGTYGNSPRNFLIAPGLINTDFSAIKDFKMHERYRVQFRAEFFNIFNNVNLGAPNSTASSSTFGRITTAGSSRIIQFALKFLW
jgi:hypothetical protein